MTESGSQNTVAVIGGTGFVGSHIVAALHEAGNATSLLVRPGSEQKVADPGASRIVSGDIDDKDAIDRVLDGADAVIYLVGILRAEPRRGVTFEAMQYDGAVLVADRAIAKGVRRFLLMSANGVDAEATPYQRTKRNAERYVCSLDLDVTVMRPSVIFGDPHGRMEFATQLYQDLVRPPIPAVGFFSGWPPSRHPVLMSPVHVDDVAAAFVRALDDAATFGKTYSLGGPERLSWTEMLERVAAAAGKDKLIIPMPTALMRIPALLFDWLPIFPVTRDQLTMLEQNNVCAPHELEQLTGSAPRAFTVENLGYLAA